MVNSDFQDMPFLQYYKSKSESKKNEVTRFENRLRIMAAGRLISMLAAGFLVYRFFSKSEPWCLVTGMIFLLAFIWLVVAYKKNYRTKVFIVRQLQLLSQEINFIEKGEKPWENGSRYAPDQHFWARDLDLFGPESFFHFLNRTVTPGGERILAASLLGPEKNKITEIQEILRQLAANPDWRIEFLASGGELISEESFQNVLSLWRKAGILSGTKLRLLSVLVWLLPVTTISSIALFLSGILSSDHIPIGLFILNLVLLGIFSPVLKRYHKPLSGLSKALNGYSSMMKKISTVHFEGAKWSTMQDKLRKDENDAALALRSLGGLLEQFDSMNNALAIVLIDGLFLYHLHGIIRLIRWKNRYEKHIEEWLSVVYETDMLCSLANFAFNNPRATYPELQAKPVLNLEEAGHPLLPANRCVTNSIRLDEQRLFLLTGSNMAGKSTFLRTIGISLLMAELGMPVIARKMQFYPFDLLMSMQVGDSLTGGESLFYAELKKLQSIMHHLQQGNQGLVLLDEILRGTNSDDKYRGNTGFLDQLASMKTFGILATNDLKVSSFTSASPEKYANICFEVEVLENGLRFDYKLKPGICSKLSASFLMEQMGIITSGQSSSPS